MDRKEKLEEIRKLLQETFELPAVYMEKEGSLPFGPAKALFDFEQSRDMVQIRITPYYENYIGIPIVNDTGMLLLGPSVSKPLTEESIRYLDKNLSVKKTADLIDYYRSLPLVSIDKLNQIARLAYYMVNGTMVAVDKIVEENYYSPHMAMAVEERLHKMFSIARQNEVRHHSYQREKRLFDLVKAGDTKEVLKELNRPLDGEIGTLSSYNPLRSRKNVIISLAGIVTRVVIEAGIPEMVAYAMNDVYVQIAEETMTEVGLHSLMVTMLCEYSDLVREHKKNSYSHVVSLCLDYIYGHLYGDPSLKEMSREVHFNANYISRVFKEEIGMTVSEFILQEKVEEAKKLLRYTKFTIIDIATVLHFHDQSHFTRVFKKIVGTTPRRYRNEL